MTEFINQWAFIIIILGSIMTLVGIIRLVSGFKNDDYEGKNKGVRSIFSGVIVLAVGILATFV